MKAADTHTPARDERSRKAFCADMFVMSFVAIAVVVSDALGVYTAISTTIEGGSGTSVILVITCGIDVLFAYTIVFVSVVYTKRSSILIANIVVKILCLGTIVSLITLVVVAHKTEAKMFGGENASGLEAIPMLSVFVLVLALEISAMLYVNRAYGYLRAGGLLWQVELGDLCCELVEQGQDRRDADDEASVYEEAGGA